MSTCRPKGGPAGFVVVLDDHRLAIPDMSGNNRLDSMRNIVSDGAVALLFMVPGTDETMRVNGRATISVDPDVLDRCPIDGMQANVAIVVEVETAFIHCAKALRRGGIWHPERWPDTSDMATPACMLNDHVGLGDAELSARALEESYAQTTWAMGGETPSGLMGKDRFDLGKVGIWTGVLDAVPSAEAQRIAGRIEELGLLDAVDPGDDRSRPVRHRDASAVGDLDAQASRPASPTSTPVIAMTMANSQRSLEEAFPGRFLLGLGVSHHHLVDRVRHHDYSKPYSRMVELPRRDGQLVVHGSRAERAAGRPCLPRSDRRC